MSAHISDDLPRLLTGDATRDEVLTAAEHLRTCPDCQQELVSAVVAHASLTSAHRFAPEIVATESADANESPAPAELPDLSSMFATVREEAREAEVVPFRKRRRLIAVAAAAAVVVGGGVAIGVAATDNSSATSTGQTVALSAYPRPGDYSAKITIDGSRLTMDASKLPKLDDARTYEVWVTNAQRTSLEPIGTVSNDNTAQFTVAPKILDQFDHFEVSVQKTNDLKQYSGISVLRGDYR